MASRVKLTRPCDNCPFPEGRGGLPAPCACGRDRGRAGARHVRLSQDGPLEILRVRIPVDIVRAGDVLELQKPTEQVQWQRPEGWPGLYVLRLPVHHYRLAEDGFSLYHVP